MTMSRFASRLAAALATTMAVESGAQAETAVTGAVLGPQSKILQYVVSRPQVQTLLIEGRRQDMALHLQAGCNDGLQVRPKQLIIINTVDLPDGQANPVSGSWEVRYDLKRCGDAKAYSTVFAADPKGGTPTVVASLPGETIASLLLIHDALGKTAMLANAKAGAARCEKVDQVVLADMHVDEQPHRLVEGNDVHERVWNETWTFDVCGRAVVAQMRFVPDPRGGGTDWTARFAGDQPALPADR